MLEFRLDIELLHNVMKSRSIMHDHRSEEFVDAIECGSMEYDSRQFSAFRFWINDRFNYALENYTHLGAKDQFEAQVDLISPLFLKMYAITLTSREKQATDQSKQDKGSKADFYAEMFFCFYVIMKPHAEIEAFCRETNYGGHQGSDWMRGHHSIVARAIRAFMFGDKQWLREEIESFKSASVARETGCTPYELPKAQWFPLFDALFFGDEKAFLQCEKKAAKWYCDAVARYYEIRINSLRRQCEHPTPGDAPMNEENIRMLEQYQEGVVVYHPSQAINYLLLMLIKIAIAYRGYAVEIEDQFLPMELINTA